MSKLAIGFSADAFIGAGKQVFGRTVTGSGFLTALATREPAPDLSFYVRGSGDLRHLERAYPDIPRAVRLRSIPMDAPVQLSEVGTLFWPSPMFVEEAWKRAAVAPSGWSLIGVTHSLGSIPIIDTIASYLTAPVRPYDALVCTSQAARAVVERILAQEQHRLSERFGKVGVELPQLPIIPLGIASRSFGDDPEGRARARAQLGLGGDDVAVLAVGRLDFRSKAHHVPLFVAMRRVAEQYPSASLILFGTFPDQETAQAIVSSAARISPDLQVRIVRDHSEIAKRRAYLAADIFVSLADNIQETFGLAPIEAMAAGLPCVVSDWDGYKDTVRHGIDGFRIPTWQPGAEAGTAIIDQHDSGSLDYVAYVHRTALATAVDIESAIDSLCSLVADRDLRLRMGEAGRIRARTVFDWTHIVDQYCDLIEDLRQRRLAHDDRGTASRRISRSSPFEIFASHPTRAIDGETLVAPASIDMLRRILDDPTARPPDGPEIVEGVLALARSGTMRLRIILDAMPGADASLVTRSVLWLAKFGIVQLWPPGSVRSPGTGDVEQAGGPAASLRRPAATCSRSLRPHRTQRPPEPLAFP